MFYSEISNLKVKSENLDNATFLLFFLNDTSKT